MKRATKLLLGLVVVAAIGLAAYLALRPTQPPPAFATVPVTRGTLTATVSATGTLNPLTTVSVGSQVSGMIESLLADFNQPVAQGEVIARIEPSLFESEVAQAKANLDSAEAGRDKAAVAVEEAKRTLERMRRLRSQNMVPQSDLDSAEFAYRGAVVEHKLREAAVAQAAAALERARVNLAHTIIYAPIDGVVVSRDVDVGQTVAASLQAPVLFTIAKDLRQMQIETQVDEAFIGQVGEGQPVSFTVFAYPDRRFHGEVAQIRLNPVTEAGVVKYNVIVRVENDDLALKPGMTATVAIEVARREGVLMVPNRALRFVPEIDAERLARVREQLKRGEGVVWTTGGGLEPLVVRLGLAGERETEVSAEALREGMQVAVPVQGNGRAGNGMRRGFRMF